MTEYLLKAEKVDILFLCEGTYPYVRGGVSTWIATILEAYPEYEFGIVFLGSREQDYEGVCYQFPPNLKHLEVHFIFSEQSTPDIKPQVGNFAGLPVVDRIHNWFKYPETAPFEEKVHDLNFYLDGKTGIDFAQFLYSKMSWHYSTKIYEEECTEPSFLHYFWSVRSIHAPIWLLAEIASKAPTAKVYHSASTGYAGFLGGLLHFHNKHPLILSEHGIYTKERKIDLLQNQLFRGTSDTLTQHTFEIDYIQKIWIGFFESLGHFCYRAADPIISLFEKTRTRQIEDGADPTRTRVIPNGVAIDKFKQARKDSLNIEQPIFCLLGRVVPIKDIKTFIRAMRTMINHHKDAIGWVVGPFEEDLSYYEECKNLVHSLELDEKVLFLGLQKTPEILSKIDVLVLSSISEGLPLVILEGYAGGRPVVATDVGCCRDLIYGANEADRALGMSGRVVSIANPKALADAMVELLDPTVWREASQIAIKRVETYYTFESMMNSYKFIYDKAINEWQG